MLEKSASERGHYLPLDGMRALLVLGVMFEHFIPSLAVRFPLGGFCVRVFFTLSGFLITAILLRERDRSELVSQSPWLLLRQFYVRRFLRIFPPFYALVLIGAALNLPTLRDRFWWDMTYMSNLYPIFLGSFTSMHDHMWSLAVEEQFYLLWPIVLVFIPRRLIPHAIGVGSLIGVAFRVWVYFANAHVFWSLISLFSCFDALLIGAALAYFRHRQSFGVAYKALWAGVWVIGVPLGLLWVPVTLGKQYDPIIYPVWTALVSFALIDWLTKSQGMVARFLSIRPLVWLGMISYGVYLYHQFACHFVRIFCRLAFHGREMHGWKNEVALYVMASTATIALAAFSWYMLERPLNNLKRHFPYVRKPSAEPEMPVGGVMEPTLLRQANS